MSTSAVPTSITGITPAVDASVTYRAWAARDTTGAMSEFTYHPRKLGDEDVEIEISHCGICGTDLHSALNEWGITVYPVVPGHEIVGTVINRGPNARYQIGDRVGVGAQALSCLNRDDTHCEPCAQHQENYCSTYNIWTYGYKMRDGEYSRGGFASHVRVHGHFAFKIPDALPSNQAAPLLCAGATVWAPLAHHKVTKGTRVGVIGIGGLGHLAVQFAAKLGAEVTAIGTSPDKEKLARTLGAAHYVSLSDAAQVKAAAGAFDLIVCTANANDMPWDTYVSFLAWKGTLTVLGAPGKPIAHGVFGMLIANSKIEGSAIASPSEIQEMLQFAAKHNVRAMIEEFEMKEVNEAMKKVHENKVRFRAVLKN